MKLIYSLSLILTMLSIACKNTTENQTTEETQQENLLQLTEAEKAAGWKLIFDGKSPEGWHSYLKEEVEGWTTENGELRTEGGNGDIATDGIYENFELELEWRIDSGGNSGIMYLVDERPENPAAFMSGPEYQIIDNEHYLLPLKEVHKAGANYALHPPLIAAANPAGEYNHAKLSVIEGKVEHWLNGKKVVAYELWTPEWEAIRDTTKFGQVPEYGSVKSGRIVLQDHGHGVSFKNIKIRSFD
ncbi:MAG: DUF1080 domain-containing protein [Bacteroidota bacterium]